MPVQNIFQSYLQPVKSIADYQADYDAQALNAAKLENAQRQNALFGLQFKTQQAENAQRQRTQNALESIYANPANASIQARENALLANPYTAEMGMKAQKERLANEETIAKTGEASARTTKTQGEALDASLARYRKDLDLVKDRAAAVRWMTAQYNDPQLSQHMQSGGTLEQSIQQIPTDPVQFADWVQQNAVGMEKYKQAVETERNNRAQVQKDIENNIRTNRTTERGQNLTNQLGYARLNAENAAREADASGMQYIQTDNGLVAVPKKVTPGQTPTATTINGPGGESLGKPLKQIPPAQNTAIIANAKNIENIDAAIAAIKANPNALGLKNVMGDTVSQYVNPEGVSVRAQLANIAGGKFHDLSGAAVSASETKRLKPFIPSDTDKPEVALERLQNLRREYVMTNDLIGQTYSAEQGYRPNPVQVKTGKPAAPSPGGKTLRFDANGNSIQ
jgi:hypothetical protein